MFTVAIVGRANVGKTTIFNRLTGKKKAIVADYHGVTRDRNESETEYFDMKIKFVDAAGIEYQNDKSTIAKQMLKQALISIDNADMCLFVIDIKNGIIDKDIDVLNILRKKNKKTILLLNKAENPQNINTDELYKINCETKILLSAEHNLGFNEIYNAIKIEYEKMENSTQTNITNDCQNHDNKRENSPSPHNSQNNINNNSKNNNVYLNDKNNKNIIVNNQNNNEKNNIIVDDNINYSKKNNNKENSNCNNYNDFLYDNQKFFNKNGNKNYHCDNYDINCNAKNSNEKKNISKNINKNIVINDNENYRKNSNNRQENNNNNEIKNNITAKETASNKNEHIIRIAVLGRPNAGKSTFLNNLLNEERLITSDIAGTTRDKIELNFSYKNHDYILIDTCGIRRNYKNGDKLEFASIEQSLEALQFADIVIVVMDITVALEEQDLLLCQKIINDGRIPIVCFNKWDLVAKNKEKELLEKLKNVIRKSIAQIKGIVFFTCSAKKDNNLAQILDTVHKLYQLWNNKISAGKMNKAIEKAKLNINAISELKIKYINQVKTRPPTFIAFSGKNEKDITIAKVENLKNWLYNEFNLFGIPLRLSIRGKKKK